jgi:hypothetical protein
VRLFVIVPSEPDGAAKIATEMRISPASKLSTRFRISLALAYRRESQQCESKTTLVLPRRPNNLLAIAMSKRFVKSGYVLSTRFTVRLDPIALAAARTSSLERRSNSASKDSRRKRGRGSPQTCPR